MHPVSACVTLRNTQHKTCARPLSLELDSLAHDYEALEQKMDKVRNQFFFARDGIVLSYDGYS